ncbi:Mariner Mos1 transposase [Eumeta japonica]|uniref:Mariner Mos1 transposase n=1 Tax=Eumeta variegata TaxID=151549 RepID=A0A4C1UER7_EUMVA|nr:Mariner Mos1 transposase [Eumeta japonica]
MINFKWYTTTCLLEDYEEIRKNNQQHRIILHHDTASCRTRTPAETTRFLKGQKILHQGHPPYSPDLAPNDFYLFSRVKNKLRGQRFSSCEVAVGTFKIRFGDTSIGTVKVQ